MVGEVGEKCRFMGPAMDFFEQKQSEQLGHLILGGSRILVMWPKLDIRYWVVRHEFVDRVVCLMVEPCGGNSPNVFFQASERTSVIEWCRIICWPLSV